MTEIPTIEEFEELVDKVARAAAGVVDANWSWGPGQKSAAKYASTTRTLALAAFEALVERIAELEAMLKRLEWASNRYQFDDKTITICPVCHATEFMNSRGHRDGCELAALLPEEETT